MRVGIYSPYLDTVGGGERYMLTIAEILSKENEVDVFLDSHLQTLKLEPIKNKVKKLLNLNLEKVNFIKAPFGHGTKIWSRMNFLKNYDLFFYLTDGSIFYSSARTSILHIQSPINVKNSGAWNKIKQSSWDLIIYNSEFTKRHCQNFWKIKSEIVYPPVNTEIFKPLKKKKQILTVGRFYGYLKDKKHELMINSFKNLISSKKLTNWSLHLAGGAGESDENYVKDLKTLAKDFPVYFYPNLEFKKLVELYGESSIYWHASGYEESDPTKMEHFGITTVEAMASGCIPIVINKGGQTEIVDNDKNGFLWNTPKEMETLTIELIKSPKEMENFSKAAIKKSEQFSKEKFINNINKVIKDYAHN